MKHRQVRTTTRAGANTRAVTVGLAAVAALALAPAIAHADPPSGNPTPGSPGASPGGTGGGTGGNPTPGVPAPEASPPPPVYAPVEQGPGVIPDPPDNGWREEPNYSPAPPAPIGPISLPQPTAPVKKIKPPPGVVRIGTYQTVKPTWMTKAEMNSVNRWAAWSEAEIARAWISVGVSPERADLVAASTIAGVAAGAPIGALTLGVPAAVVGAIGGAVIGAGIGAAVGTVTPPAGLNVLPFTGIGAGIGAGVGAAVFGIPAAALGGLIGGLVGGGIGSTLGAGDPNANPADPWAPQQRPEDEEGWVDPRPNTFELNFSGEELGLAGGSDVNYQVKVDGEVNVNIGPERQFIWTAKQADEAYDGLGPLADPARQFVKDNGEAARQIGEDLAKNSGGALEILFPMEKADVPAPAPAPAPVGAPA